MKTSFTMACALAGLLGVNLSTATAQEGDAPPAPYDLNTLECGELDSESGYRPLRPSHIAGEDLDILCKVTVGLAPKIKGSPKAHTIKLTVSQGAKVAYDQVRDARVLNPGSRVILFIIPAEKLPTEAGKVTIRAELSKPVNKPGLKEQTFTLTAED
jgi:hypothetical protein